MTLDPRTILLSLDHPVDKYTASCGLGDSGCSASCQSFNNTDPDNSNPQRPTDAQGQLRGNRELHFKEPTSFSSKLKRGRGRPRSDKSPKTKRRKVPPTIAPKLQAPNDTLHKSEFHGLLSPESQIVEKSVQSFLDISILEWKTEDPYPFHHQMDTSVSGTPRPSTSALNQQANARAVAMRQSGRPILSWDVRIDSSKEVIGSLNVLMNSDVRSYPSWAQSARVLKSKLLRRNYIYQGYLNSLGHSCPPMKVWKTTYHLGEFAPVSMCAVSVTTGYDQGVLVDFCVLRGSPPPGGVDFMIGEPTITTIYGPNWSPNSDW